MVTIGQLWQHQSLEWLMVRVIEVNPQHLSRPITMVKLQVENERDPSTHGVVVEFDDSYIKLNYNLIEDSVPTWEV